MGGPVVASLPASLGLDHGVIAEEPTYLVLKETPSQNGTDYQVHTLSGEEVVHVEAQDQRRNKKAKAGDRIDKVAFFSPKGDMLYSLQSKFLSQNMYLVNEFGDRICCLSGRPSFGSEKMSVYFVNSSGDGEKAMLFVKGHLLNKSVDVFWGDARVATIGKKFPGMGDAFAAAGTSGVQVAPGADLALVAAIAVGLSEKKREATMLKASLK